MSEADLVCAIDPGRDKCGVAIVERSGRVRHREVVDAGRVPAAVRELVDRFSLCAIVIGDRTGAQNVVDALRTAFEIPGVSRRMAGGSFEGPGAPPAEGHGISPRKETGIPPGEGPSASPGPFAIEMYMVDEHLTSVEARKRYLADHPGRGLARLLPAGLRTPDRPYDDYVAVILAERYFAGRWKQKLSIPRAP